MSDAGTELDVVEVDAAQLPIHCPPPGQGIWNTHPRVYLPLGADGQARCPYCGTIYKLTGGGQRAHH